MYIPLHLRKREEILGARNLKPQSANVHIFHLSGAYGFLFLVAEGET
jgi:hypothetical protein